MFGCAGGGICAGNGDLSRGKIDIPGKLQKKWFKKIDWLSISLNFLIYYKLYFLILYYIFL